MTQASIHQAKTQVVIWLATAMEPRLRAAAKRYFYEADELFLSVVTVALYRLQRERIRAL
jgi:hypothetical protein